MTADADAQAVMKQVLLRYRALKLREITFLVDRHTGRDAGVIKTGSALLRLRPEAICAHLQVEESQLNEWQLHFAHKQHLTEAECRKLYPKELLALCIGHKLNREPRMRDFEEIARRASLRAWQKSDSFGRIAVQLQEWFPSDVEC